MLNFEFYTALIFKAVPTEFEISCPQIEYVIESQQSGIHHKNTTFTYCTTSGQIYFEKRLTMTTNSTPHTFTFSVANAEAAD